MHFAIFDSYNKNTEMNIKDKSLITSFQSLINTSDKIVIVPHNIV